MLTMLTGDSKDRALTEYARVLKPGGVLLTKSAAQAPSFRHGVKPRIAVR